MVREDSPLRHPPRDLSRGQVLILDGIRYSGDMADLAYERLASHLQRVAALETEPTVGDIATAMLDAWSIVDSAHRFRDLVANLPGVSNLPWKRLLLMRTEDVADLRNRVQHQLGELDGLLSAGGQLWGYISWHELRDGRATGRWHMMAAGADYVGDRWIFMGPARLPFVAPRDRIRLNAFARQVYLARTVAALRQAIGSLEAELSAGLVRAVDAPVLDRRGADAVMVGVVEVFRKTPSAAQKGANIDSCDDAV